MKKKLNVFALKSCPSCKSSWDGGSVLDMFIKMKDEGSPYWKDLTDEQIKKEVQESYGGLKTRWSRRFDIEVQGQYDGISYVQCPDCKSTWNIFTGLEEKIGGKNL